MEIPITNIYYLLCYAWDALEEKDELARVDYVDSPDLLNLFAKVLVNGTRRLIRRGLDRGYIPQEDQIPGVRGKLLISKTVRLDLLRHGRTACIWDELEFNTLPNQILKTTFLHLQVANEMDGHTRAKIHDLLRWLAPVQSLKLRTEHFRRIQLHRNNRIYAFLLHVCEFIHEHWLPQENGGQRHFRDFVRNGLPQLFEKFVLNFYSHELDADWHVHAPVIDWDMSEQNEDARSFVPRMETDVCLQGPGRTIILDTKFYSSALKSKPYGGPKLVPANLYQLYTYVRQKAVDSGWEKAEGVLLYPRTVRDLNVDFTTHGHRIRALTLDLAQPSWLTIHEQLKKVVML